MNLIVHPSLHKNQRQLYKITEKCLPLLSFFALFQRRFNILLVCMQYSKISKLTYEKEKCGKGKMRLGR